MRRHADKILHAQSRHRRRARSATSARSDELTPEVFVEFRGITRALLRALAANPTLLDHLHHRAFEELVAQLLEKLGYEVELTPPAADRGVDIYARKSGESGPLFYVVECKRYRPDRRLGPDLVRMLAGVVWREGATKGILATTSTFTPGAYAEAAYFPDRLTLRDRDAILAWVRQTNRANASDGALDRLSRERRSRPQLRAKPSLGPTATVVPTQRARRRSALRYGSQATLKVDAWSRLSAKTVPPSSGGSHDRIGLAAGDRADERYGDKALARAGRDRRRGRGSRSPTSGSPARVLPRFRFHHFGPRGRLPLSTGSTTPLWGRTNPGGGGP